MSSFRVNARMDAGLGDNTVSDRDPQYLCGKCHCTVLARYPGRIGSRYILGGGITIPFLSSKLIVGVEVHVPEIRTDGHP